MPRDSRRLDRNWSRSQACDFALTNDDQAVHVTSIDLLSLVSGLINIHSVDSLKLPCEKDRKYNLLSYNVQDLSISSKKESISKTRLYHRAWSRLHVSSFPFQMLLFFSNRNWGIMFKKQKQKNNGYFPSNFLRVSFSHSKTHRLLLSFV